MKIMNEKNILWIKFVFNWIERWINFLLSFRFLALKFGSNYLDLSVWSEGSDLVIESVEVSIGPIIGWGMGTTGDWGLGPAIGWGLGPSSAFFALEAKQK